MQKRVFKHRRQKYSTAAQKVENIYQALSDENHRQYKKFRKKYLGKISPESFQQQALALKQCNCLMVKSVHGETHIVRTNRCHHRLCTTCNELQASIRTKLILQNALPHISEKHRLIMLTLTVQNCSAEDLHNTVTVMHKAFKYLMDTKGKNGLKDRFNLAELTSWIRTTEFLGDHTDFANGVCSPHLHILMQADWDYYSGERYLRQEDLSKMWKHALARGYQIKDYKTGEKIHKSLEGYIVDIRVVCDGREKEDVERSIHEVVKGLKPRASKDKKDFYRHKFSMFGTAQSFLWHYRSWLYCRTHDISH